MDALFTNDQEVLVLLNNILSELKSINIQLALLTEEEI